MTTNMKFLFLIAVTFATRECDAQSKNEFKEPDLQITIDGYFTGGNIWRKNLATMQGLVALVYTSLPQVRVEIVAYQISISNGNELQVFNCKGALIPDTVKTLFSKLKFPYKVEFKNIVIKIDGNTKHMKTTMCFESDLYKSWLWDYTSLFYDFKNYKYDFIPDTIGENKHIFQPNTGSEMYEDTTAKIIVTNCNSINDTCSTNIYLWDGSKKDIGVSYQYHADTTESALVYYQGKLIASINYKSGNFCGNFKMWSYAGEMIKEGEYVTTPNGFDTVYRISPITLKNEPITIPVYKTKKSGVWKFYEDGNISAIEKYDNN